MDTAQFPIMRDYGIYASSDGAMSHAIPAGATKTTCGLSVVTWTDLLRDDRQLVTCPACRVRVFASEVVMDSADGAASHTLHGQMAMILERAGRSMTTAEIAEHLEATGYRRPSDGKAVRASQVSARVRKYPALFRGEGSQIYLVGNVTDATSVG